MKYPQSVAMPRDVVDWLDGELEARGIDSVVYTRYILSLMLHDSLDFDLTDYETDAHQSYDLKGVLDASTAVSSCDPHALKRLAVERCLMSATSQKCEMESLVDELSVKLQKMRGGGGGGGGGEACAASHCSASIQPSEFSTYSDYNKTFPPLLDAANSRWKTEPTQPASAWTRGILRASLKQSDPAFSYDESSPPYCFPLSYGLKTMYSGDTLDIYGPRLYERSANRSLQRMMASLDKTFHQYWTPNDDGSQLENQFQQNYTYFENGPKMFSSTLFLYNMNEKAQVPQTTWSLGGSTAAVDGDEQDSAPDVPASIPDELPEEDLLTSARTHFRPIRSHDSGHLMNVYEDGTTFAISTDIEPLPFTRSESGSLFLETGKYMEFKHDDENSLGDEDFVPKFRVQQSNEKFCQTDDVDLVAETTQDDVLSIEQISPDTKADEFYFPGDDQLALHLSCDDLLDEGEVAQIVSGRLHVRWKTADAKLPLLEPEPDWDAEDAAMVDDLVDSPSPTWTQITEHNNSDTDADDDMEDNTDTGNRSGSAYLPQLTDSIWNPKSSTQACETCRGGSSSTEKGVVTSNILSKQEWQEIWKQPVCHGCQDLEDITVTESDSLENSCTDNLGAEKDIWRLGETLSAYLKESREQAVDLLSVWGPALAGSGTDSNGSLNEVSGGGGGGLRDLWSCGTSDDGPREVWSPLMLPLPHVLGSRPRTYSLLRDELCEDGDRLLSDLSCLHLQQVDDSQVTETTDKCDVLDHDEEEEKIDKFLLSSLSPVDEKGPSVVSLWATCNIIAIGENKSIFDERNYNSETAQNERKRRHSSSQKMCDMYLEGECRRPHCRFRHDVLASPLTESLCITAHQPFRYGRELNRAFTF